MHHWSYERENWLDVIPMCSPCHARVHRGLLAEPRTGRWYLDGSFFARRREGIERAKAAGVYVSKLAALGPKIDELHALGFSQVAIGRELHIGRATVARYLASKRQPEPERERAIDEIVNRERP